MASSSSFSSPTDDTTATEAALGLGCFGGGCLLSLGALLIKASIFVGLAYLIWQLALSF